MIKRTVFAFMVLLFFAGHAQAVSGSKYLEWADASDRITARQGNAEDTWSAGMLIGYTLASVDSHVGPPICRPSDVTTGQLVAVAVKYIRGNPAQWNWDARSLILLAFAEAFPCK